MVRGGDSIDVEGGPLQEVCVWRRFAELASNANRSSEHPTQKTLFGRHELTMASLQTQNIVSALTESLNSAGTKVLLRKLPSLNLTIPPPSLH